MATLYLAEPLSRESGNDGNPADTKPVVDRLERILALIDAILQARPGEQTACYVSRLTVTPEPCVATRPDAPDCGPPPRTAQSDRSLYLEARSWLLNSISALVGVGAGPSVQALPQCATPLWVCRHGVPPCHEVA